MKNETKYAIYDPHKEYEKACEKLLKYLKEHEIKSFECSQDFCLKHQKDNSGICFIHFGAYGDNF